MDKIEKAKEWIKENAPMLAVVYENKYVGMLYDRFGSLPSKQQKQVIVGFVGFLIFIVVSFLLFSYLSLWSTSSKRNQYYSMNNLLQQYQKQRKDQSGRTAPLEQNARLAPSGELKRHLLDQGRNAQISPKMLEVEEKGDSAEGESGGGGLKIKQASVVLNRVNLAQLKTFLNFVEFGTYNLGVSSIKITNDEKLRGYMKVEIGVVAYLFQGEDGA